MLLYTKYQIYEREEPCTSETSCLFWKCLFYEMQCNALSFSVLGHHPILVLYRISRYIRYLIVYVCMYFNKVQFLSEFIPKFLCEVRCTGLMHTATGCLLQLLHRINASSSRPLLIPARGWSTFGGCMPRSREQSF